MRKFILCIFSFLLPLCASAALQDKTLRVDYVFGGTDKTCEISLDELCVIDGWAGRRVNMDSVPLRGNGQVKMEDPATGEILYMTSFSTLFQEWQATEEATKVRKSFENVFLLPMPEQPVLITVELYDFRGNVASTFTHAVDPSDILIRPKGQNPPKYREIVHNGPSSECIDVIFLPEGYSEQEMDVFYADCQKVWESFMEHEPFKSLASRFNVIAADIPSADSGVSVPRERSWKETTFSSHFDTFYTERYLTTLRLKQMHDKIAGLPYEHIIILANTETYGGGGIYNSYVLTTAHHAMFKPVVVHEFGHAFAGLADEYFYDDQYVEYYYPDAEPWEPNISTKFDFGSKWEDMLSLPDVGLLEGAGYQSKGVWRSRDDCRMRTNTCTDFCPVCQRAIQRMIDFYTVPLK